MTALGIALGIAFHITYGLTGIALLIKSFPTLYTGIKTIGAAYLIWLGLTSLRALKQRHASPLDQGAGSKSFQQSFRQGLFTNLMNPKASLFIMGLFTSAVPLETTTINLIMIGATLFLVTLGWFLIVALLFGQQPIRTLYLKLENSLQFVFGLFFVLAGVLLIQN
jgi:threonine/homoserine/homoserine lactone efflux protein